MLRAYAEASVVDVESQLERATRKKVGTKDEEVMNWLRCHEFTKKEGEAIILPDPVACPHYVPKENFGV